MTAWRWQALGLSAVCFVAAAVNGYFAGGDLLRLLRGFAERHPVISSAHFMLTSLLLTPVGISVGVLFLFAQPATPEQMKNASRRSGRWTGRYLLALLASIVAALIAPVPQYWTVDHVARQRGYVPCPTPGWPRHQPDRWALPARMARASIVPARAPIPTSEWPRLPGPARGGMVRG